MKEPLLRLPGWHQHLEVAEKAARDLYGPHVSHHVVVRMAQERAQRGD